jgi:drug/metabolite transporter (DMT)-like permease
MRIRFTRIDALLLVMTLIWGSNFAVVKTAMREIPEYGFGALRFLIASALFIIVLQRAGGLRQTAASISPRDWRQFVLLAIVGHSIYQVLFLGGVRRTSVANSSLIFGCTPIVISLVSAYAGHERIAPVRWAGVLISFVGIYIVVSQARQDGATLLGDLLVVGAVATWAAYTIGSRPLLSRYSPLVVTGFTMIVGAFGYLPLGVPSLRRLDWSAVSGMAWVGMVYSAVFALVVAYLIWYTAVQRIGNSRTSLYSNVVPLVAMTIAALTIGEPLTARKIAGAVAVLVGLALTRVEPRVLPAEA